MHEQLAQDQLYVTVDILILTVRAGKLNLLLSRRPEAPFKRCWALPGRFIALDESAETAVKRLLAEMLPLQNAFMEQLYTFTEVNRDPRGRVISTAYLVAVPWSRIAQQLEKEETAFHCFEVSAGKQGVRLTNDADGTLDPGDLAFDHWKIIETGLERLRGKIAYTEIGFRFLDDLEAFSLSDLQTIYEAVLDEPADSSNFRRAILGRYQKTGRLKQSDQAEKKGRGRPAALYSFEL